MKKTTENDRASRIPYLVVVGLLAAFVLWAFLCDYHDGPQPLRNKEVTSFSQHLYDTYGVNRVSVKYILTGLHIRISSPSFPEEDRRQILDSVTSLLSSDEFAADYAETAARRWKGIQPFSLRDPTISVDRWEPEVATVYFEETDTDMVMKYVSTAPFSTWSRP